VIAFGKKNRQARGTAGFAESYGILNPWFQNPLLAAT
jgi:hypothetical protein